MKILLSSLVPFKTIPPNKSLIQSIAKFGQHVDRNLTNFSVHAII